MSVTRTWLKCRGAEFNTRLDHSTGVISAHGELDAANADRLAECVASCVKHCPAIVLDLSELDFIGTAGFSALHRINVVCSAAGADWAMVPSRAVTRLLRICDPDGVLPVTPPPGESSPRSAPKDTQLLQLIP